MNNKVYRSEVDKWYIWLCIFRTIVFMGSIYLCYRDTLILIIDIVFLGIGLLMIYDMLFHTDYTVNGEKLHIRCGLLFRMDLPISKITVTINKSTFLSSTALSARRIGLKYGKTNWVYVSPKDQADFISTLKSINLEINII